MAGKKTITVSLDELKVNFFVRRALNQDHVIQLSLLYEAGEKLPPIDITPDREIIDGRHRFEAAKLANFKELQCELVEKDDRAELILHAFNANVGGALSPSTSDIVFAISLAIEEGASYSKIMDSMPFPKSVTRKYWNEAKSMLNKQKLNRAIKAVTENDMTVTTAAEKFDVDLESLRAEVSGKKRKKSKESYGLDGIKAGITKQYRSMTQKNAKLLQKLIECYEDGDLKPRVLEQTFEHIESLQKRSETSIRDWRKRFEVKLKGEEKYQLTNGLEKSHGAAAGR